MPDRLPISSPTNSSGHAVQAELPGEKPGAHQRFPAQPLLHLDELWLQVAGTECNLSCTHCFVSAGPGIDRHRRMSRAEVRDRVTEGLELGVKEFYFTGGEPFVNPQLLEILADTLAHGPCTVLTNGTLFTIARIAALRRMSDASRYALEVRVSLDGVNPMTHDRFRGAGAFERTMERLRDLERYDLLPIVTLTHAGDDDVFAFRERAIAVLRAAGLTRPRLKLLPMFQLGRETGRTRGYAADESLAGLAPGTFEPERLQCGGCRAVTSQGVFVCPLLVDEPSARMGGRLAETLGPFELSHGACYTCWVTGMSCANA